MRLNRFLSQCGLGSRRGCEELVLEGRVSVNGRQVKELATKVEPGDQVTVDGRPVRAETGLVIALHKPKGYICTRSDERSRMTIYDLLPKHFQTLHHVGRLDKESEGLLLMTNRGDVSHRLSHPSQGAEKEYEVVVDQPLDQAVMAKLVKGMLTEEGYARAERAWMVTNYRAHVVLKQGLKRQIRLMFYQLGFEVERLTRTRIGWLELRGLPRGGWKELSAAEVERFFAKDAGARPAPRQERRPSARPNLEPGAETAPSRPVQDRPRPQRRAPAAGANRRPPAKRGESAPPARRSDGNEGSGGRRGQAGPSSGSRRPGKPARPGSKRPPSGKKGRGGR